MNRRFRSAVRYHLWSNGRAVGIFYLVICLVGIFMVSTTAILVSKGNRVTSGALEMASVVFLFVCGLNSFKENFAMFLQNGFSRKTMYGSFLLSALMLCLFMALVDETLAAIFTNITVYQSAFFQVYAARDYVMSFPVWGLSVVWGFSCYLFAYLLGYLITSLYYRMNKWGKLSVSIGVPALLMIALPSMDAYWFQGLLGRRVTDFFLWAIYGSEGFCPWCGVRSFLIGAAVLMVLSFLLIRRAQLKR